MTTRSDNFPSTGDLLATEPSFWSAVRLSPQITSANAVISSSSSAVAVAMWNSSDATFLPNQQAQATVTLVNAADYAGVAVLCSSAGGANGYIFGLHTGYITLKKYVAGAQSTLAAQGDTFSGTPVLKLVATVSGGNATLVCYVNGSVYTTGTFSAGSFTDSSLLTGQPGLMTTSVANTVGTWSATDGAASGIAGPMYHQRKILYFI